MYKAYAIAMSRKIKFQQIRNRGKRSQLPSLQEVLTAQVVHKLSYATLVWKTMLLSLSKSLVLRKQGGRRRVSGNEATKSDKEALKFT